jgi:hypothetical protein
MANAEQVIRLVPDLRPMREILDLEEYTRKNHGVGLYLVNCHVKHWSCVSLTPILIASLSWLHQRILTEPYCLGTVPSVENGQNCHSEASSTRRQIH